MLKPGEEERYFKLGVKKEAASEFRGAILHFSKVIELNAENHEAWGHRGYAKYNLMNHAGAIKDFDEAIELDPEYGESYCYRGVAKKLAGDKKGGCIDLNKAIELGYTGASIFLYMCK